jgi:hypothetical protein
MLRLKNLESLVRNACRLAGSVGIPIRTELKFNATALCDVEEETLIAGGLGSSAVVNRSSGTQADSEAQASGWGVGVKVGVKIGVGVDVGVGVGVGSVKEQKVIETGANAFEVVPLPNCPSVLSPQHFALQVPIHAHV